MKIFNVMFTTRLGGVEQSFLDYCEALHSLNLNVIPIIHKKSKIIPSLPGKYYLINNFSKYDPIALFKLKKLIKTEQPSIILTHGNRAHYLMRKVTSVIPIVGISHNYSFDYIIYCDYIITVNKNMKLNLCELNYPQEKTFHIPNMIKIPPSIKYTSPNFHPTPIIGMIARLDKIKGADILINALHILKKRNIYCKLLLAGDGPEYNNIINLVKNLNLEKEVELIGWVKDKEVFYNNIDILCVPSRYEPFGLVILEGLKYSKPIIISDLSGPMEIIKNKREGLIFKSEDAKDLAEKIENILYEEELKKIITKNGFKKAFNYDINIVKNEILKILKEIYNEIYTFN